MNLELTGKTALVTASTGGIGLEIATALAAEGAVVVINGRSKKNVQDAMDAVLKRVPSARLVSLVADNSTPEGNTATIKEFPNIDILINNLGIYEAIEFFDISDDQWQRIIDTNIMSGVRLSRHYLKEMIAKNEGRIIFIGSEAAVCPVPALAHYSATKTMQLSISRTLAELTKGTKVTVNTVLPGSTRTEGVKKYVQDLFPELDYESAENKFMAENQSTSLIARLIDPKEIADTVCFFSSSLSSAFNGSAVRVDGGIVRTIF